MILYLSFLRFFQDQVENWVSTALEGPQSWNHTGTGSRLQCSAGPGPDNQLINGPSPGTAQESVQDSGVVPWLVMPISELCMLDIVVNNTVQWLRTYSNFNTEQI